MTVLIQPVHISIADYLDGELISKLRHEYLGGTVHAMSGGTVNHSAISLNVGGILFGSLKGKQCRAFNSDMKLRLDLADRKAGVVEQMLREQAVREPVNAAILQHISSGARQIAHEF